MRLHHRQNTQWTFRNRSQSRSRNENYGNDQFRGRSRDRNQRRREETRSRSNSRVSTNEDHVRCYRCREYDHAMTSFLDIHYGYDADVIETIYYYLDVNTFGMVPTLHYGIL